jgi:hypothetical protein
MKTRNFKKDLEKYRGEAESKLAEEKRIQVLVEAQVRNIELTEAESRRSGCGGE